MKNTQLIRMVIFVLCFSPVTFGIAQENKAQTATGASEIQVSELRKNGKYRRITETRVEKALISRKEEVSIHDDGKIDFVFVKLFNDGEMTFFSTIYKATNRTIRNYYHQGKLSMQEGDLDGDGFFETVILFDADEQPAEAFQRNKDGTVTQFNREEFSKLKKTFALAEGEAP